MIFRNAQLKETVVEFRWVPVSPQGELLPINQGLIVAGTEAEEFLDRFRSVLASEGFISSERLIPQNGVHQTFTPILRFRRAEAAPSVIVQVGLGVMSVHALPPYQSWAAFQPEVMKALNWLRVARHPARPDVPATASLRYINGFGPEITADMSEQRFLERMLQIRTSLPDVLTEHLADIEKVDVNVAFSAMLKNGMQLVMNAGTLSQPPSDLVLDTTLSLQQFVPLEGDQIERMLDEAHELLNETFVAMTVGMHDKLGISRQED